jgi:cytochrome c oxidase assembly factor CtaG
VLLPILHGTADGPFLLAWSLDPFISVPLAVVGSGYAVGLRKAQERGYQPLPTRYVVAFYAGLAVTAVALLGPVDTFNDELFFLHMIQHLLLMLVAAPLLLTGRPVQVALRAIPPQRSRAVLRALIRPSPARATLTALTSPVAVILVFNGVQAVWHVPAMYVASLESEPVHWIMHLTFFGAGLLLWWVIIDPVPRHHKFPFYWVLAVVASAMAVGKIIGGMLSLADEPIYSFYRSSERPWGFTVMADQQLAGVIMLVGGGFYFLALGMVILARALVRAQQEQEHRERARRAVTRATKAAAIATSDRPVQ